MLARAIVGMLRLEAQRRRKVTPEHRDRSWIASHVVYRAERDVCRPVSEVARCFPFMANAAFRTVSRPTVRWWLKRRSATMRAFQPWTLA